MLVKALVADSNDRPKDAPSQGSCVLLAALKQPLHQLDTPLVLLFRTDRDSQASSTTQILRPVPDHQPHLLSHALVDHLRHVIVGLGSCLKVEHLDEDKVGLVAAQNCACTGQRLQRRDELVAVANERLDVLTHLRDALG